MKTNFGMLEIDNASGPCVRTAGASVWASETSVACLVSSGVSRSRVVGVSVLVSVGSLTRAVSYDVPRASLFGPTLIIYIVVARSDLAAAGGDQLDVLK